MGRLRSATVVGPHVRKERKEPYRRNRAATSDKPNTKQQRQWRRPGAEQTTGNGKQGAAQHEDKEHEEKNATQERVRYDAQQLLSISLAAVLLLKPAARPRAPTKQRTLAALRGHDLPGGDRSGKRSVSA